MSISKQERKKGAVYVVRVWDPSRASRYREKTFDTLKDARSWESQHTLAKRKGELDSLDAGKETLSEFIDEWWTNYAEPHLEASTRKTYKFLIDKYIKPELGRHQLRQLSPTMIVAARLGTGAATRRKSLAILQGILERAVEWQRLSTNPVKVVKKPRAHRGRRVEALSPAGVEGIRSALRNNRDKALVSLLAYAGLRPGEALALRWEDIGASAINVDKALALGEEKDTKTGRTRSVRLMRPLRADLAAYRLGAGSPAAELLVFPMRNGSGWTTAAYRNWRRRVFRVHAGAGVRPYDLRHSYASLLFAEGHNPAYIAEQLGHSIQTLLSTYVHLIEELKDEERVNAEDLIREARRGGADASAELGAVQG